MGTYHTAIVARANELSADAAGGDDAGDDQSNTGDDQSNTGDDQSNADQCVDTDNGALDSYNDPCSGYTNTPSWCGTSYDDDDFVANTMCCACGGGSTGS